MRSAQSGLPVNPPLQRDIKAEALGPTHMDIEEPAQPRRWWSDARDEAPLAFGIGSIVGAAWPIEVLFIVSRFTSGAIIGAEGPKNWADSVMGCAMILTYTGPIALALLYFAGRAGFGVGGHCAVAIARFVRSRRQGGAG